MKLIHKKNRRRHNNVVRLFIYMIFQFYFTISFGQNLIINGDFEEFYSCPVTYTKRSYVPLVPGWFSPNEGTPDYFNSCSKVDAGVPFSWAGKNPSRSGSGYAGIYTYGNNYREYIVTELSAKLVEGYRYYFSFYYLLSRNSHVCTDRIGARIHYEDGSHLTFQYIKDSALTSTTGMWEFASDTIIATGKEKSIEIGNFDNDNETRHYVIPYRGGKGELYENRAYYLIDNVSLIRILPPSEGNAETFVTEKVYTLKNVQFEFNSAELKTNTLSELDRLADFLLGNSLQIAITGHTDETGSVSYNQLLSENRAKSVASYLIFKGVAKERIETTGKGETELLKTTGTQKERDAINRRVEFMLKE